MRVEVRFAFLLHIHIPAEPTTRMRQRDALLRASVSADMYVAEEVEFDESAALVANLRRRLGEMFPTFALIPLLPLTSCTRDRCCCGGATRRGLVWWCESPPPLLPLPLRSTNGEEKSARDGAGEEDEEESAEDRERSREAEDKDDDDEDI